MTCELDLVRERAVLVFMKTPQKGCFEIFRNGIVCRHGKTHVFPILGIFFPVERFDIIANEGDAHPPITDGTDCFGVSKDDIFPNVHPPKMSPDA